MAGITASASCRHALPSPATRLRWKRVCRWSSGGSWRRCAIASSSAWRNSTRRSANWWRSSTSGPSASARDRELRCLRAGPPGASAPSRRALRLHHWTEARVNIDYHVQFDRHFYSVPYTLGQRVEIRSTATTIEIFHRGQRVASHARSSLPSHNCPRASPQVSPAALGLAALAPPALGQTIGPPTAQLFAEISPKNRIPRWVTAPAWAFCDSANAMRPSAWKPPAAGCPDRCLSLRSVKSILERSLDHQPLQTPPLPLRSRTRIFVALRTSSKKENEC